ncbi:uncharacterized protein LOC133907194 [Phragmites australis]|uniref:uncharacterized protein LOC133907194 n=1 Tax=Phragmites australis TaxID=29695 RepID=UPI002D7A30F1|nr:uncharacterized protein LOC133907194 [Phragmites australis]
MASSPLPPLNFGQYINEKLTRENYLLCKAQVMPFLYAGGYISLIEGTEPCPDGLLTVTSQVPNPLYLQWVQRDRTVLGFLLSSLTREVLSQLHAKLMQISMQLANLEKGDMTGAEYFPKVQNLADMMASISKPLIDQEVIAYFLAGLEGDYDPLMATVTLRNDPIVLSDFYVHFLNFEARLTACNKFTLGDGASANFARGGINQNRDQGGNCRNSGVGAMDVVDEPPHTIPMETSPETCVASTPTSQRVSIRCASFERRSAMM